MASTETSPRILRDSFGALPDGRRVERFRLLGGEGFEAVILTYGGIVQALRVPDRDGRPADIVLGHESLEPYIANRRFFGATIGRYANRIAGGAFQLDGESYRLPVNNGPNSLHGGVNGFDRQLWTIETVHDGPVPTVTLAHVSPDGAEGYPGTLSTRLTYALTGPREFSISFEATTDRPLWPSLQSRAGVLRRAAGGSTAVRASCRS